MLIPWDWIVIVVLFGGAGWLAWRYYRGQVAKYGGAQNNPSIDEWRSKSDGCH